MFFLNFNRTWQDSNGNGVYDGYSDVANVFGFEIYLSTHGLCGRVDYFDKAHQYRMVHWWTPRCSSLLTTTGWAMDLNRPPGDWAVSTMNTFEWRSVGHPRQLCAADVERRCDMSTNGFTRRLRPFI